MPSHAIPPGHEGRPLRRAARQRRSRAGWKALPGALTGAALVITVVGVLGDPAASHRGITGAALAFLWNTLGAVTSVLIIGFATLVRARLRNMRAVMADPRQRRRQVAAALLWLAIGGACLIAALTIGSDHLLGRASIAAAAWSAFYSLVLGARSVRHRQADPLS